MTIEELKKIYVGNTGKINAFKLRESFLDENPYIKDAINALLPRDDLDIRTKVSMLIYNDGDLCKECKTSILDGIGGRVKYTCRECVVRLSNEKREETVKEKYGVASIAKLNTVKEKRKTTSIEKYGVENPMQNEHIKYKLKDSLVEKYGVEHHMHLDEFKDKIKKTNKEKYGVEHTFQSENVKNKIKKTNREKYGVEHHMHLDEFKDKIKKTNKEKYGVENFFASDAFRLNTLSMNSDIFEIYKNPEKVFKIYKDECNSNLNELGKYFNVSCSTMSAYFKRFDLEVAHNYSSSMAERMFIDKVKKCLPEIAMITNARNIISPYELDLYFPDHNLAIEFCGSYWHSELYKDVKYHYNKWKMCNEAGIQLLTFWDLEFNSREEQIISFIKSKVKKYETIMYARQLIFKEITEKQYEFFENNHIQGGKCNIDRNFGLYTKSGILVGCVSFSKHHRNADLYTLNRLAFKRGVNVVGGVGKLLKNALELINKQVITWSDNRYSTGEIYTKNGFEFSEDLKPDYSYFDSKNNVILSKQSQQKKLIGCPKDMTEHEFCKSLGRYRLWDCGKKRFVYTPKII